MSKRAQQIDAFFRQGQHLHTAGRLAEAEQIYRQVLSAAPRHAEALHALAALALQTGRPEAAGKLIQDALAIRVSAEYLVTRANILLALRDPQAAAQCCEAALKGRANYPQAYQTLGHALSDSGNPLAAIDAYRSALRLHPALPDIRNNIGTALRQAGQLEAAESELSQAPPDAGVLVNLSSVQKERGKFEAAEATLRKALKSAPNDPILLYNWSLLMHLIGRTAEAWHGWEQRFRAGAVAPRPLSQPQWTGNGLGGRKLLIHSEQGLGDIIQFSRYLPVIEGNVVFEAPARLMRLLSSNQAMPPMTAAGAPLPPFDVVSPLLSLPARMTTPPVAPPYLFPDSGKIAQWRARLPTAPRRIAITFQGNPARHEDKGRSLPLACFAPLAAIPGVRLISLQKFQGEEQLATAPFPVETLPGLDAGPDAFIDTAAVMSLVDLVITSDTSIAHLAGALACPVWVALRRVPDWRWMLDRTDSPWYPTMRLFRQSTDGDWAGVFNAMAAELSA